MAAEDTTLQELLKEVSELKFRVGELGEENRKVVNFAYISAEDTTLPALLKEVSELKHRVDELGEENRDLRDLCTENGVQYEERLAARRHKRYFAHLCDKHPIGEGARWSEVPEAAPIV